MPRWHFLDNNVKIPDPHFHGRLFGGGGFERQLPEILGFRHALPMTSCDLHIRFLVQVAVPPLARLKAGKGTDG